MELISREMAIDHIRVLGGEDRERLIGILNNKEILPTIESRPTGEWIEGDNEEIGAIGGICSNCGKWALYAVSYDLSGNRYIDNYCKYCGAEMESE